MPRYNHRKHLERTKRSNTRGPKRSAAKQRPVVGIVLIILVALLSLGIAYPQSWQSIGLPGLASEEYRLGLDLQGGAHLVYEANMGEIPAADQESALASARDVIERRVNAFGVSEPRVQAIPSQNRIIVELAGVLDVNEAIRQIGETPTLEFKEPGNNLGALSEEDQAELERLRAQDLDAAKVIFEEIKSQGFDGFTPEELVAIGQTDRTYGALVDAVTSQFVRPGQFLAEPVETEAGLTLARYNRVNSGEEYLVSQILICSDGNTDCLDGYAPIESNIRIGLASDGITPENFAERFEEYNNNPFVTGSTAEAEWISAGSFDDVWDERVGEIEVGEITAPFQTEYGFHIVWKQDVRTSNFYDFTVVNVPLATAATVDPFAGAWVNTELSGKHVRRATVEVGGHTGAGQPFVSLQFNAEGDRLFGDLTSRLVGRQIGIFIDGQLVTAPVVQQAIYGGQAQITGQYTIDEATELATRLNSGALPVPIELLSQQTVGPTLGAESLSRSLTAGLLGFLLVAIFMVLYYRLPGLLSVLSLVLYGLFNFTVYKLFGVTLTLAGIAGFVLSVGMAVDANVLIFERLREELRDGRGLRSAVAEGFKRAWTSIRDGNITTLIAAAVLYLFSSSFVRGFAVTLSVGVILSMLSAIIVTKTFLLLTIRAKWLQKPFLFGTKRSSK